MPSFQEVPNEASRSNELCKYEEKEYIPSKTNSIKLHKGLILTLGAIFHA